MKRVLLPLLLFAALTIPLLLFVAHLTDSIPGPGRWFECLSDNQVVFIDQVKYAFPIPGGGWNAYVKDRQVELHADCRFIDSPYHRPELK